MLDISKHATELIFKVQSLVPKNAKNVVIIETLL